MSFPSELRHVASPSQPRLRRADVAANDDRRLPTRPTPARRLRTNPFLAAFALAGLTYAVTTAALIAIVMPAIPPGSLALGSANGAAGMFVVASLVPAVITGLLAQQSRRAWRVSRIAATYLPMFLLVAALQFAGPAAEALLLTRAAG
ncbi:MAG: hypothetical protein KIT36_04665 [Alphaproteobacteria bacterium]|nr:hypothetical protein [Alphaproteobacteria bacterium]